MNLRITATYAATDGSMPESVDITFEEVDQAATPAIDLMPLIDRLIGAAGERVAQYGPGPALTGRLTDSVGPGVLLGLNYDGQVIPVSKAVIGTKFLAVGTAVESMQAGHLTWLRCGRWSGREDQS